MCWWQTGDKWHIFASQGRCVLSMCAPPPPHPLHPPPTLIADLFNQRFIYVMLNLLHGTITCYMYPACILFMGYRRLQSESAGLRNGRQSCAWAILSGLPTGSGTQSDKPVCDRAPWIPSVRRRSGINWPRIPMATCSLLSGFENLYINERTSANKNKRYNLIAGPTKTDIHFKGCNTS